MLVVGRRLGPVLDVGLGCHWRFVGVSSPLGVVVGELEVGGSFGREAVLVGVLEVVVQAVESAGG